jgi:hypothetical protein
MKRFLMAMLAAALLAGIPGAAGLDRAAASQPTAENTRSFYFTERIHGDKFVIEATASAVVPIACNTRMLWTYRETGLPTVTLKAKCTIQAVHRNGQKVTFAAAAYEIVDGVKSEAWSCEDSATSDRKTGRLTLQCNLPVTAG